MKKAVTITLSKDEIKKGKQQAKDRGLSLSTYLGQLIRKHE